MTSKSESASGEENVVEGGTDKKDGSRFRIKIAKIGATTAVAIGLVAGGIFLGTKLNNNGDKKGGETGLGGIDPTEDSSAVETSSTEATIVDPESLVVTVAPTETTAKPTTGETSGETNPEKQYDYSKAPKNAVESFSFEALTADQQAEIKEKELMTIEEFQALPQAEQLKFAYWFFTNYKPRFDYLLAGAKIALTYTENPTTPQEYSDNYAYIMTMTSSIYTVDGTNAGAKTDILTGQKIMVLRDTATEVHNEANNSYVNQYDGLAIFAKLDYSVVGYKATENGMILNMHQETTDTITVQPDAADMQRVMEPINFTDINGREITLKTCVLSIPMTDSRVVEVSPVE